MTPVHNTAARKLYTFLFILFMHEAHKHQTNLYRISPVTFFSSYSIKYTYFYGQFLWQENMTKFYQYHCHFHLHHSEPQLTTRSLEFGFGLWTDSAKMLEKKYKKSVWKAPSAWLSGWYGWMCVLVPLADTCDTQDAWGQHWDNGRTKQYSKKGDSVDNCPAKRILFGALLICRAILSVWK